MSERALAALCAAAAAGFAVFSLVRALRSNDASPLSTPAAQRWSALLRQLTSEGTLDESFGGRKLLLAAAGVGAILGFSVFGLPGMPFGALFGPFALRGFIRARRRRYATRVDACAPELAQALASSLAAGRSVRGALLTAGAATPQPLATELDRAAVDMTLGGTVTDSLAALRSRTGSPRIESLAGAIELHRGSGGDLVKLMRELSEAFRARDRALADARAASAQARYTSYVVAAIPVVVAVLLELARPGAVTGALRLVPTAMMLLASSALMTFGVVAARRISAVRG
ncbi:MAG: type II secretion system F family protein [Solirubrobacterales bacterium]